MNWNPNHYLQFGDERTRPAADLLARVPLAEVVKAADLGCGPGNSTAVLAARYPGAVLIGVDSSAAMIEAARAAVSEARFAVGDFETFSPTPDTDLIYANAAFQWSADPVGLSARLFAALRPGAALAVQVPQNYDQPSHTLIGEVCGAGPWAERLAGVPSYDPGGFARAETYARALAPYSAQLDVWTTTYMHRLKGPNPVFAWMSATGLRPFLATVGADLRPAFEAEMKAAYRAAYPAEPDEVTHFPFTRLFVVAVRAG